MKSTIIILASFLAFPALSQYKISGVVKDHTSNETLIGATVYFPNLYIGTTSDVNGNYSIDNLPAGNFNVEISFIGYKTDVLHLHLSADTIINVELQPDLKEMKEVIVTGLSKSTELKLNPVPAVVTSNNKLFEFQATNLIDGIAKLPGISQITTGPAISKPIIRGLGSNRVLTLYNGLRQEGQQWGEEHGIEIDEFSIDKVEIIKGPGSIAYGSDAMAGVINFLTPHEIEEGKIRGSVNTGYQTNNRQYYLSASTSGNIKGINWRARATGKQAANYTNAYDGRVYNSGFNEIDWDAQLGINRSWGFTHFYVSRFKQRLGIVEGERDADGNFLKLGLDNSGQPIEMPVSEEDLNAYQIDIPSQQVRHFKVGSSNQFYFGESSLMVKLDYQLNQREEFGDVANPTDQELYFKLSTYNYNIQYLLKEYKHWGSSIGINGMYQANQNLGEVSLIPEYGLFDFGIYALTQKEFAKVMVSGGLRFDNRRINSYQYFTNEGGTPVEKFAPFVKSFANISASAGISYQPTNHWNFKFNLARGFRAPNLAELSSNGSHEGSFRYEYGNINLVPETSFQTDLGVEFETDHITWEIAAFYNRISNYIYQQKLIDSQGNDSIPDSNSGAIAFKYVQGEATLYGGEAGLDIHPHPLHWLHFDNTFSLVYAQQLNQPDSMRNLPFIPAPQFKSELRANIDGNSHLTNSFIRLEWQYFFDQNRIFSAFNTETSTPGYGLINAGIGTEITNKEGITRLRVGLTVNNLLDKAYQNHLSRLKYAPQNPATGRNGIYNMGRNFSVKIMVPFNFK